MGDPAGLPDAGAGFGLYGRSVVRFREDRLDQAVDEGHIDAASGGEGRHDPTADGGDQGFIRLRPCRSRFSHGVDPGREHDRRDGRGWCVCGQGLRERREHFLKLPGGGRKLLGAERGRRDVLLCGLADRLLNRWRRGRSGDGGRFRDDGIFRRQG